MMNIKCPTLLLDETKCRANITRMAEKAAGKGLIFRPHFKTHQSAGIGKWFREAGVTRITVSSVSMATAFAGEGWDDITIAFPVNVPEMAAINRLAARIKLNLLVESVETARVLGRGLSSPAGIFLKIDTGYHRTGIDASDLPMIDRVLAALSETTNPRFAGFLTHAGHTYHASNPGEVIQIHRDSIRKLQQLKDHYSAQFPGIISSTGDTPSCSIADDFDGADEIRPGNFVFYDLMQKLIGSCSNGQIAVAMACPVVALHPERGEVVIYGGSVHFSKEQVMHPVHGMVYGMVAGLLRTNAGMAYETFQLSPMDDTVIPPIADFQTGTAGWEMFYPVMVETETPATEIKTGAVETGSPEADRWLSEQVQPGISANWGIPAEGFLSSLSQEHGIVKICPEDLDHIQVGDLLVILPVHSCLTAACMRGYLTTSGRPIVQIR